MSLIESVFKTLGQAVDYPCAYKVTVISSVGAYVEGVEKILEVDTEKVIFSVKQGKILLAGKNLKLQSFVCGDVSVLGNVLKVEKL